MTTTARKYQIENPATPPVETNVFVDQTDEGDIQIVKLAASTIGSSSLIGDVEFDTILITYTDATKDVISKVEWKLSGAVVKTYTPTFAATTDTWVKS